MWVDEASTVNIDHITRFFTNQQYDKESGLYYYNARYYDPHLGSFITPDPAMDGINHYNYANSNPIRYSDPTGLWTDYSDPSGPPTHHPDPEPSDNGGDDNGGDDKTWRDKVDDWFDEHHGYKPFDIIGERGLDAYNEMSGHDRTFASIEISVLNKLGVGGQNLSIDFSGMFGLLAGFGTRPPNNSEYMYYGVFTKKGDVFGFGHAGGLIQDPKTGLFTYTEKDGTNKTNRFVEGFSSLQEFLDSPNFKNGFTKSGKYATQGDRYPNVVGIPITADQANAMLNTARSIHNSPYSIWNVGRAMNCADLQAYIVSSAGLGNFGARNQSISRAFITEPNQLRSYLYNTFNNVSGFYYNGVD